MAAPQGIQALQRAGVVGPGHIGARAAGNWTNPVCSPSRASILQSSGNPQQGNGGGLPNPNRPTEASRIRRRGSNETLDQYRTYLEINGVLLLTTQQ